MQKLLIVTALPPETKAWRSIVQSRECARFGQARLYLCNLGTASFHLLQTGMGACEAKKNLLLYLADHHPQKVVLSGFCGGLDPSLQSGDAFLAHNIISPAKDIKLSCDESLNQLIQSYAQKKIHQATLLTVDQPLLEPAQKTAAFQKYQAAAVDMENYPQAEVLIQSQIPFTVLRFVLDDARRSLAEIQNIVDERGKLIPGRLVWETVRKPKTLKKLGSLGLLAKKTRQEMSLFGKEFLKYYFKENFA